MSVYTSNLTATAAFFERIKAMRGLKSLAKTAPPAMTSMPPKHIFGNVFLTAYTQQHRDAVSESKYFVVDAETTGLTPYSKPISVGGSAKIGPEATWSTYKKQHEATLNVKLRMRVWSVQLSTGAKLAWDLDKLSDSEIQDLLRDTIHGRIVIGHNLAFDFTWAVNICGRDLAPALVLDTLLIARCIKPASVYTVHRKAARGDEAAMAVVKKSGNASVSLGALAVGMDLGEPDKSYQHPRNWAVSHLSVGHYEYVLGDIDHPLEMLLTWGKSRDFEKALENLGAQDAALGASYFDIYCKVPMCLAKISHTGMPVHVPTLRAVQEYRRGQMPALIESVVSLMPTVGEVFDSATLKPAVKAELADVIGSAYAPAKAKPKAGTKAAKEWVAETDAEKSTRIAKGLKLAHDDRAMGVFMHKLEAQSSATLAPMKLVLGVYADMHDCTLDETEDGMPVINAKSAKLKGAADLPGWKAWSELQGTKKLLSLCEEYLGISGMDDVDSDFRQLHPLLSARTATGRVASQVPNVMNLPRPGRLPADFFPLLDKAERQEAWSAIQFRAVVRAPDGHTLISADYGQIELRIAGGLALRAISDSKKVLAGEMTLSPSKGWFVEALRIGADDSIVLVEPSEDEEGFEAFSTRISLLWRRLMSSPLRPMVDAFKAGQDPHLLTGITLAATQGLLDLGGMHPVDFLKSQTKEQEAVLKKTFSAQRQSAKALNFGLLYGMQYAKLYTHGIVDYGLSWSLDDAKASRSAWFDLFPEIAFLQIWHQMALMPSKKEAEQLYKKNNHTMQIGIEAGRVGASATLRGRPVVATEAREILNYSDQGSGADMLLQAVTTMSPLAFDCIIDLIHDEILMCVPNQHLDEVKAELERAMLSAADHVLAPYGIPAEAEGDAMVFWRKI